MKYKKYKDFREIREYQEVKLNTDDNWNGLFGIVENVTGEDNEYKMAVIFCIENPDFRYLVFPWNLDSIEMVKY
jgi:hypothetical protein